MRKSVSSKLYSLIVLGLFVANAEALIFSDGWFGEGNGGGSSSVSASVPSVQDTYVLFGGTEVAMDSADGADVYLSIVGTNDRPWDPFCEDVSGRTTVAGEISGLRVKAVPAPGAGESWTLTLMKNCTATDLTCTVSGTDTTCEDLSNSVTVAVDDNLDIRRTRSSAEVDKSTATWSLLFGSYTDNTSPFIGSSSGFGLSNSATRYLPLYGSGGPSGVDETQVIATTGTLKNLRVQLRQNTGSGSPGAPGEGTSFAFTVRANGDTALTCTISDTSTDCTDTTNEVAVSPGDLVNLKVVPTGTPSDSRFLIYGVSFVSDVDGEFNVMAGGNDNIVNTGDNYAMLGSGGGDQWETTESGKQVPSSTMTVKSVYARTTSDPLATGVTYGLRVGGATSALTCQMVSGDTTCNSDTDVSVSGGDLVGSIASPVVSCCAVGSVDISYRAVIE